MKITLRPHQVKGIELLRAEMESGNNKLVMVAPTGAGKTIMFSFMATEAVKNGLRVLILTDRKELSGQAGGALDNYGMKPIIISASKKLSSLNGVLYVGMVETLSRRLSDTMYVKFLAGIDLVILDECHKQAFNKIFPYITPGTTVIGATATPKRTGRQKSMDEFYESMIEVCTVKELIEAGYLSKPKYVSVKVDMSSVGTGIDGDYDEKQMGEMFSECKLYEGVYENYMTHTPGEKALVFSPDISSSLKLVSDFESKGIPCRHLDCYQGLTVRAEILEWFNDTPDAVLSNVGILTTGFDQPDIKVIILYRATKSLSLYLQMAGRGSRIVQGSKSTFTILDFGNNIKTHGRWHMDRSWSLKKETREQSLGIAAVKECPKCGYLAPISCMTCADCGHVWIKVVTDAERHFIMLEELSYEDTMILAKTASYPELEIIQKAKKFKIGWVYHQLKDYNDFRNFGKFKNYHPAWAERQWSLKQESNHKP